MAIRRKFGDEDVAMATVPTRRDAPPVARGLVVRVLAGPDTGLVANVSGTATIGRAEGADVRLSDPTVSAFHAEIAAENGAIRVRDVGSRNGTYYEGARLGALHVPSGARLQIGSSWVDVHVDTTAAPSLQGIDRFGELGAESPAMRDVLALLARLARTDLSVSIEGPTGTGKELAARALHTESRRAKSPFVVVDCTSIPETLAESILFGHERGAFTGATEARAGLFESAEDGTIFLDEIGELPLDLQPKLLRVLERREVARVGSSKLRPVRARVVSATWRDLRSLVNDGRFREDLYFRIAQARVTIPKLADRPEDIPPLVRRFLERLPADVPCARTISSAALAELVRRDWPGNARELRHAVERAAMLAAGDVIVPDDLAFERRIATERTRLADDPEAELPAFKDAKRSLVDDFERAYLERLLARTGQNLSRASALAGIERHHLRDLLRKHGLRSEEK